MKLLIAADDLTGALDTGVQFARYHLRTKVTIWDNGDPLQDLSCADVLVVATQTRHLSPKDAYERVFDLFSRAKSLQVFDHWFKKLDSTLRGNVGAELQAMAEALDAPAIHLLNAFPAAGRTTVCGIQYVNSVPLAQTDFARDPFNPIRSSSIAEIVSSQSDYFPENSGNLVIHDAQTAQDIHAAVASDPEGFRYAAGCAGLAEALGRLLGKDHSAAPIPLRGTPYILCGSLNPASFAQIEYARSFGIDIGELPRELPESGEFQQKIWCAAMAQALPDSPLLIHSPRPKEGIPLRAEDGARVAQAMGQVFAALLAAHTDRIPVIVGGDTLIGCIHAAGITSITALGEILPGAAVFGVEFDGVTRYLVSKAGGFGAPDCLVRITQALTSGFSL